MSRRTDVPDPVLFGRETELGQVREFIVRREGSPASLLLVGEPGIGKSSIWTAGLAMARSAGVTVLQHRAVQAEAAWAFAGLGDLLGDAIGDVLPALAQPRSRALSVALLLEDPGEFPSDPHALGLATRDALRLLAARNPVLIAIDDLQWLDPGSSAVLASAVRRGADERVGLLATSRVPAQSSATGLEAVFASSARVIGIGPLSLTALSHLLAAELELHLARPRLTQLWELTSGNPLFALEIGRELVRTRSVLEPGQPPPVSDDLQVLLAARLARLSPDTRRVLTTAAAMTRPTVDALARIHGEPRVATAIAEATVQSIAAVRGGRVHFAHPLHASVALGQLSTGDRRRLHRRIAAEADDLEDRARHLALASGPGAEVARILDDAAERASARGATGAAAELAQRAAELTPAEQPTQRRARLLAAADSYRMAGDRARGVTILDGLMVEDPGAPDRASVLFALARARRDDLPTIERYCQEALRAAANDEGMQVDVLAFLSWMRLLRGAVADAVGAARSGLAIAERLGEAARLARAIARTSQAEMLALDVTPGLLDRGLAVEQSLDIQLEFHESPSITETQRLLRAGRLNEARQQLLECDARALDAGDEGTHGHLLFHLIQVETYAGRYGAALQYADAARELSEQLEDPQFRGLILATAARVEAHAGRMEDARRDAHAALEVAHRVGDALFEIDASTVLGFVELSLGNVPEAASWLAPLPDRLLGLGYRDPTHQAWSPATEALVAAGQLDLARRLVAEYRALAELSGSPRALGPAARVHGLLIMAEGRPEEALEAFDRSLAALAATTAPFEVARTHLASGVALRLLRRRGAARAALESARDSFAALGSTVWARRASQELGRLGGRRPAGSTLTPTQRRVATLAVDGRSNKEIAAAMGVSVNTVEAHLTAVYRALDVASRVELVHRLETTDSSKPEGPPA